tara:strand:- start:2109 stop:2438 length:330 start_codon:yes stop_codon:yes gene_type:complete
MLLKDVLLQLSYWVATVVVQGEQGTCSSRIQLFIRLARKLRKQNDFNGMLAILAGLGNVAVQRLKKAWTAVGAKYRDKFNDMNDLMSPHRGMFQAQPYFLTSIFALWRV